MASGFLSHRRLVLSTDFLAAPLPEIQPGAMPRLATMLLRFSGTSSTLPPSWGARRDVLPALKELSVDVHVSGSLPPQWARGFGRLTALSISNAWRQGWTLTPAAVAPLTSGQPRQLHQPHDGLPPQWASGFPALQRLGLNNLGLPGSFPPQWHAGSFPCLENL